MFRTIVIRLPRVIAAATLLIVACASVASAERLRGRTDFSLESASGWLSLRTPTDFEHGDHLQLMVVGGARLVLVRLLPWGDDPTKNNGIQAIRPVSPIGLVDLTLDDDEHDIGQVSVHGGPFPWGISLGSGNGPAKLLWVRRLPSTF